MWPCASLSDSRGFSSYAVYALNGGLRDLAEDSHVSHDLKVFVQLLKLGIGLTYETVQAIRNLNLWMTFVHRRMQPR